MNNEKYKKLKIISLVGLLSLLAFSIIQFNIPKFKEKVFGKPVSNVPVFKAVKQEIKIAQNAEVSEEELNIFFNSMGQETNSKVTVSQNFIGIELSQGNKKVIINAVSNKDKLVKQDSSFIGFEEYNKETKEKVEKIFIDGINEYLKNKNPEKTIKLLTLLDKKIMLEY